VRLYTSGVGSFVYDAEVDAGEALLLTVGAEELDDVLKSLHVEVADDGELGQIRYQVSAPLDRRLGELPVDFRTAPSFAELLRAAVGELVRVQSSEEMSAVEGRISGVGSRSVADGSTASFLTLISEGAAHSIKFDEIERLSFLSEDFRASLEEGLAAVVENRNEELRTLEILTLGDGPRRVRLSHLRETPAWKMSYRLNVSENDISENDRAQMQAWAIVENTSLVDWSDVELTLVAGRPLAFRMNLSEPVFVERPLLDPPIPLATAPPALESLTDRAAGQRRSQAAPSASFDAVETAEPAEAFGAGVVERSVGASEGSFFSFALERSVSVGAGEAALVPVLVQEMDAGPLLVYDASVVASRPLRSVELTNTSASVLPPGPVAVYEGGRYAGDARSSELAPGGRQILSYAVDGETRIHESAAQLPEEVRELRISEGVIEARGALRFRTLYEINRDAQGPAELLIVHARRAGYELSVGDEVLETELSDGSYHVRVNLEGRSQRTIELVQERVVFRRYSVSDIDNDTIVLLLEQASPDDETRERLNRLSELRNAVSETGQALSELQTERDEIFDNQERIRENLEAVGEQSALSERYQRALAESEDRLEEIEERIGELREELSERRAALSRFIRELGHDQET
jgi:hypothetical protein